MKALSIGREQGCDIVINDSTDVISRRHAILNISSSCFGKVHRHRDKATRFRTILLFSS